MTDPNLPPNLAAQVLWTQDESARIDGAAGDRRIVLVAERKLRRLGASG